MNLSKISQSDRDEEHRKNKQLFDIRQDLSIDKDAKATILTKNNANMISRNYLIISGLNIETRIALDSLCSLQSRKCDQAISKKPQSS